MFCCCKGVKKKLTGITGIAVSADFLLHSIRILASRHYRLVLTRNIAYFILYYRLEISPFLGAKRVIQYCTLHCRVSNRVNGRVLRIASSLHERFQ